MDKKTTNAVNQVPFVPYERPEMPDPPLHPLELTEEAIEKGYALPSQKQHFLPGLTSEMLDWFWANMDKGYYLWAPGSHKKFKWVKDPYDYGFEDSVHMIAEVTDPDLPVFGGEGVEIHRLHLDEFYPFTTALSHVICEGVFNDAGELVDSTIHEWEDVQSGIVHITATVQNTKASMPPGFVLDLLREDPDAKLVPNYATDHEDYEASQWPVFLPKLYDLWKDHPDPAQSVQCDLEVYLGEDGRYHYVKEDCGCGKAPCVSADAAPEADSNGHDFVDLGLSVKWATMNIGAAKSSDNGLYFSWGETATKDDTTWGAYKYGTSADDITKYNYDDGKLSLEPADDAAVVNWGGSWRMPTQAEWEELCDKRNCAWEWTCIDGTYGCVVTSKKPGYTDRSIFLPAAGYFRGQAVEGAEKSAYYWSSTRNEPFPDRAICLYFIPNFIGIGNNGFRNGGFTVRPVIE